MGFMLFGRRSVVIGGTAQIFFICLFVNWQCQTVDGTAYFKYNENSLIQEVLSKCLF